MIVSRRWTTVSAGLSLVVALSGCGSKHLFVDAGVGNGTSVDFPVSGGVYTIEFEARDREPWFGCNFGLALVRPEGDPLAPGRVVATTEVVEVGPRGSRTATLVSPSLPEGDYFIRYLGDRPCDWTVRVSGP